MKILFEVICLITIMVNYNLKIADATKKEKELINLRTTLSELCHSEIYFQSQPYMEVDEIKTMDTKELKSNISRAYTNVQCSYIFSAQIYMRLIEGLLMDKEQLEKVPQNTDLSFTKEAAQMLATLYNVKAMQNNFANYFLMWIVLLFSERVLVYIESVIKRDQAVNQTNIVDDYNSVSLLLEHYMVSEHCVGFSQKNKLDAELTPIDLKDPVHTLDLKKIIFEHRLETNAKNHISPAGHEWFSLKVLSLNRVFADIEATKRFLKSSGVEIAWEEVMPHLKNDYDRGTQTDGIALTQQIKSLTIFHEKFILMIRIINTRMMLKFIMYVNSNKSYALTNWETVLECRTKIARDIFALENYLDIQDEYEVKYVRGLFRKRHFLYKIENTIKNLLKKLNEFAVDLHLVEVYLPFSVPKSSPGSMKTMYERIRQDVTHFVTTLMENTLSNINFSIIKSLKRLISTNEYFNLRDFEKNYCLK